MRTFHLSRRIGAASSGHCNVIKVELDSHADTSVVGKNALIIHKHDRFVMVTGFDPSQPGRKAEIVDAAVLYVSPGTFDSYILVINQAIYVPELDDCLLCPMQCRMNGVRISETPKFLVENPTALDHSIQIINPEDPAHPLTIPLQLHGVLSYFPIRCPTVEEYEDDKIPQFELTAAGAEWDPYDGDFSRLEASTLDFRGHIIGSIATKSDFGPMAMRQVDPVGVEDLQLLEEHYGRQTSLGYTQEAFDEHHLAEALESRVNVSLVETRPVDGCRRVSQVHSGPRVGGVDHVTLAKRWKISLQKARDTVRRTTQRGIRTVLHPTLSRRFRTNDRHLRYRRMPCNLYSDTMFSSVLSSRGNKCAQIFASDFGWSRAFPMERKGLAHEALSLLFQRDGVPPRMICDGAAEMTGRNSLFFKKLKEAQCHLRETEPYSPWQNAAEREIRELKKGSGLKTVAERSPIRLWDFALELESYIRSHTAHDIFKLDGRVPETIVSGETADISPFCEFGWWEWVKFRDNAVAYPDDKLILGKYLGPSIDVGPAMTARIMKANGEILDRSTLRRLTPEEEADPVLTKEKEVFLERVYSRWGDKTKVSDLGAECLNLVTDPDNFDPWEDPEAGPNFPDLKEELDPTPEYGDVYLNAEILFSLGGEQQRGIVRKRKRDADGNPMGREHQNPILDTRLYEVEFADGRTEELAANAIALAMYSQCDIDGNEYTLLDSIVDYRVDGNALTKDQQRYIEGGKTVIKRSTKGWELLCQWQDGTTSWQKLCDLKESHPIETAEFAFSRGIADEPAFNWWAGWVLKKRANIIAKVKTRQTRYQKKTHKYGIELPKTVEQALEIDRRTGTTFWADAIAKEMKNVRVAFEILPDGQAAPIGYQHIRCHMVFDIKMEDFKRKARLVAGGHMTEAPPTLTYASVVSRETVRIALLTAALNNLDVWAADVLNAYITAPNREKIWTTLGKEFGEDCGKKAIVVRALYGLKSAGAAFRAHLAGCMRELGYTPCRADPDLWLKEQTAKEGKTYYSYILCYVDDLLVIHHDPKKVMDRINGYFPLKEDSVGPPDQYLGAKLKRFDFPDGSHAWGISPAKYVQSAVANCEKYVEETLGAPYTMYKKAENPFMTDYKPAEDVSPELGPDEASYFMQLVGILRWMVELGRVDISTEVSMLASHAALPRLGHLDAAIHVFSYLKCKPNSVMMFDPWEPKIGENFIECDWKGFYEDATEAIPPNAPRPLGKGVTIRMYVDSDHAGDKTIRRSRTGFVIFLQSAMIDWLSKRQSTVESSVFGAEFCAMKHGIENLRGIRYKLRMMGVPINGPSYIYGDNMSVVTNSSRPESTLKKKSNSVCYHAVREAVAMGECLVAHIPTKKNLADLFTKILGGIQRKDLVSKLLWYIYD